MQILYYLIWHVVDTKYVIRQWPHNESRLRFKCVETRPLWLPKGKEKPLGCLSLSFVQNANSTGFDPLVDNFQHSWIFFFSSLWQIWCVHVSSTISMEQLRKASTPCRKRQRCLIELENYPTSKNGLQTDPQQSSDRELSWVIGPWTI